MPRHLPLAVCLCCLTILLLMVYITLRDDYANLSAHGTFLRGTARNVSTTKQSENAKLPPSRCLVIASTAEQDTSWVETQLGNEVGLSKRIYVVDNASSEFSVPLNKGHEAMVYLTYIINEYDNLSDITLFLHAHQFSWHNNDLLDRDAAEMIRRLIPGYVIRNGYVNLRCHHEPGCPSHIFPHEPSADPAYPEIAVMGELVPSSLAQPCCAQMAVSRDAILALSRQRYIDLRDWLLQTPLGDELSGRIFEYLWQYIWGHTHEYCPSQSVCYCDGYGVCFGGEEQYATYDTLRHIAENMDNTLKTRAIDEMPDDEGIVPRDTLLRSKESIEERLGSWMSSAIMRGTDPRNRALEAGRPWTATDYPISIADH
ncbi:hypothetical protein E4T50_12012 [Aureobasidium sp. EXF-12298]|nr:hypothetical protein E4T50_12012 [Aureobasidium sp. EXF-12298]